MAFDLSAMLADVSKLDTSREQIEYLPLEKLRSDERNFYELSDIDQLADNIATLGLQQPIRVRPDGDGFKIVSGHRRTAAIRKLAAEDPEKWAAVSCIVERDNASEALQEFRLICANAATRKLTDYEVSEQAARMTEIICQLKEEGFPFPGRTRATVAEIIQQKEAKLARLALIRKKLNKRWTEAFKNGELASDAAYRLAQLPAYLQTDITSAVPKDLSFRLTATTIQAVADLEAEIKKHAGCPNDFCCHNRAKMMARVIQASVKLSCIAPCPGCCMKCGHFLNCPAACSKRQEEKQSYNREKREAARIEAEEEAEKNRPILEYTNLVYSRVQDAMDAAACCQADYCKTASAYPSYIDSRLDEFDAGKTPSSLPFNYEMLPHYGMALVATADLLGVTTDYLLGRDASPSVSGWHKWPDSHPTSDGDYVLIYRAGDRIQTNIVTAEWIDSGWSLGLGMSLEDMGWTVLQWIEFPEDFYNG